MLFLYPPKMLGCEIGMLVAVTKTDMPWTQTFITCRDDGDDDDEFLP